MTSNLISSMTRLDESSAPRLQGSSPPAELAAARSEVACLARLDAVLKAMEQLLSAGKAEELPEVCGEAASIARAMSNLYSQSPLVGSLAEDAEQRKTLLAEIRRKRAFCSAVLRRWRRRVALQREVLSMAGEPATYTPTLLPATELR
jgi:hypothetical protein